MKTETVANLLKAIRPLLPSERGVKINAKRVTEIMNETRDRFGEFTTKLRPSDALAILNAHDAVKSEMEVDQLAGI